MPNIFISHAHSDRDIARRLSRLITELFGEQFKVNYSTSAKIDGGIPPGKDWFSWINEQIEAPEIAVILLTTNSIEKPWVIWEAGAVAGAVMARRFQTAQNNAGETGTAASEDSRVFPLALGLKTDEIPGPFARTQLVDALNEESMQQFADSIFQIYSNSLTLDRQRQYHTKLIGTIRGFVDDARPMADWLPLDITEGTVQEWLRRVKEFQDQRRFSETRVLEGWIDIAFGREHEEEPRPIDFRLHGLLGDMYAAANQPTDAARQYEMARRLARRDVFILRRLGKAYLEQKLVGDAERILNTMERLAGGAFIHNPEDVAFKARIHREKGDGMAEKAFLEEAYRIHPQSTYIGDLFGQALVATGNRAQAVQVYQQVVALMNAQGEKTLWTTATELTAAFVQGDEAQFRKLAEDVRSHSPTAEQAKSIRGGLERLAKPLRQQEWLASLALV